MMHPKDTFEGLFDAPIKKDPHSYLLLDLQSAVPPRQPPAKHPVAYKGLAFHNPFDMNSYPITNPPLFDSTMYLPYTGESGVPRRRRISISNGQIGQIVNHEAAFFMEEDLLDDLADFPPYPQPPQHPQHSQQPIQGHPQQRTPRLVEPMLSASEERILLMGTPEVVPNYGQPAQLSQALQPPQALQQAPRDPRAPQGPHAPFADPEHDSSMAGVPPLNHLLIYNNEVIFNPNNGPIPGTAAWKKERLLERNRVAASKCRQRKKQAQKQLQDNMDRHERKISDQENRLKKYDAILRHYNTVISAQLERDPRGPLSALALLVNKLVDEISLEDLK